MSPTPAPAPSPASTVTIDDLVEPRLSAEQRALLDSIPASAVDLSRASLVSRAERRTALADPDIEGGDPTVWTRVDAYLAAVEADQHQTGLGRYIQQGRVVRLLSQRALLHDLLARHPEIHDIDLPAPLIVVGLPRSGTTHLVNLIAADPQRRALPYWESQAPFPTPGRGPGVDGLDPRYVWARNEHGSADVMTPLLAHMHDRYPEAIEEEVELLDLDFSSYQLEWNVRGTQWFETTRTFDQDKHFAYLRTVLQALTFLRGPRSWVLKCPQHLENLGPLIRTFPDAGVVFTHRDPVASITSAVTMLAYGDRVRRTVIEPEELLTQWADRYAALLDAVVRDRDLVPAEQSMDVRFRDLIADDLGVVERLHGLVEAPYPEASRQAVAAQAAASRQARYTKIGYDLLGQFGTHPDDLRQRFAGYLDRFGITPES